MKKHPSKTVSTDTDLRRRRLLVLMGLAGAAGLARAHPPLKQESHCLLSLREADYYASHDLAG